jgi:hypothetical protein
LINGVDAMKHEILEKLKDAPNFSALTTAVLELCEPFGAVHSFRFFHNKRAGSVTCCVELDSFRQQQALARELGATIWSGQVCLDFPVRRDIAGGAQESCGSDSTDLGSLLSQRRLDPETVDKSGDKDCALYAVQERAYAQGAAGSRRAYSVS